MELRRSFHRARLFNLSAEELRARVLVPWARGEVVEAGDREWSAADSDLTVLEGPSLDSPELAVGQGWHNAKKAAHDVTARLLAATRGELAGADAARVAVLADIDADRAGMASFVADLGLTATEWDVTRPRLLEEIESQAGRAAVATIVVLRGPLPPQVAMAVGFALGALGARAILVVVGDTRLPPMLEGLPHLRIDSDQAGWPRALANRLEAAGCELRPAPGWDAPGRLAGTD